MNRFIGLDYGRKRIGIAISDLLGWTAQPFETWQVSNWRDIIQKLELLIREKKIDHIVIGYPLTLKGEKGVLAREVERFSEQIKRHIDVTVTLWDERLTSVQAQKILQTIQEKPGHKKERIDRIAAVLILQSYLEYHKGNPN